MQRFPAICFVSLLVCLEWFAPALAQDASIEARFDAFSHIERSSSGLSTQKRGVLVGAAFDTEFGSLNDSQLRKLSTPELKLVFRAANASAFYALRDHDLDSLLRAFAELSTRGATGDQHVRDVIGALVAARRFSEARRLAAKYESVTELESIPSVHEAARRFDAPTALDVKGDGSLVRKPFNVRAATQILVISHPLCHFSQNAVAAIESDPALRSVFLEHSRWLAPVDRKIYADVLSKWNAAHPIAKHSIAYNRQEWSQIDSWNTPSFYFLRHGKVIAKVTGWPQEGRRRELLDAAMAIGLRPTTASQSQSAEKSQAP